MAFARHQFELSQVQADGHPLLVHLQAAWNGTGKMPAKLANAPELPDGLVSLWQSFLRLHKNRNSNGFGVSRITDVDIDAARRVRGLTLEPWQLDIVNRTDDLWLSEFAPKPKGEK